jgi:hypothetical protein
MRKIGMAKKSKIAKTAPAALTLLWEEEYFRAWRKQAAIVTQLAKRGNNFSGPELGMALKRAKHLTRKGKRGSYEYIQKYPFVKEQPVAPRRKT